MVANLRLAIWHDAWAWLGSATAGFVSQASKVMHTKFLRNTGYRTLFLSQNYFVLREIKMCVHNSITAHGGKPYHFFKKVRSTRLGF